MILRSERISAGYLGTGLDDLMHRMAYPANHNITETEGQYHAGTGDQNEIEMQSGVSQTAFPTESIFIWKTIPFFHFAFILSRLD